MVWAIKRRTVVVMNHQLLIAEQVGYRTEGVATAMRLFGTIQVQYMLTVRDIA
jgi:hypothetical protein